MPGRISDGAGALGMQEEHHPLLARPPAFQPALSLSGAASLARVDSSFGMRALERLNPEGTHRALIYSTQHSMSFNSLQCHIPVRWLQQVCSTCCRS